MYISIEEHFFFLMRLLCATFMDISITKSLSVTISRWLGSTLILNYDVHIEVHSKPTIPIERVR